MAQLARYSPSTGERRASLKPAGGSSAPALDGSQTSQLGVVTTLKPIERPRNQSAPRQKPMQATLCGVDSNEVRGYEMDGREEVGCETVGLSEWESTVSM